MSFTPNPTQYNKNRLRSTVTLERPRISLIDRNHFLRYAFTYWEHHYDLAKKDDKLIEAAGSLLLLESS